MITRAHALLLHRGGYDLEVGVVLVFVKVIWFDDVALIPVVSFSESVMPYADPLSLFRISPLLHSLRRLNPVIPIHVAIQVDIMINEFEVHVQTWKRVN